ncbi:hypothetical protein GIS00_07370 [Nakamurella sp. YIM 132087]|uniref:Uncharacterized protein n=1 Tax=Nakamurella alba TaxID=2665158 RepID=A0A7K1FI14_9ACTN|nr:hypothetical protein [Nakamurella alba]MTD13762.1 hypothetical protein [Nakamurella alba]
MSESGTDPAADPADAVVTGTKKDFWEHYDPAPLVARFREFVQAHGAPGVGVVQYLGRSGARVVVVAADGLFTDAVVPNEAAAADLCEQAGVEVEDWSRELTARITLSPADRLKMAGGRSH